MYMRIVNIVGRTYGLFQGYRDSESGKVRQHTIVDFSRVHGENDPKVIALKKMYGTVPNVDVKHDKSLDFGVVFILFGIWQQLKLDKAFQCVLKSEKRNVERTIALIRLIVFHRVSNPGSKLHCLHWAKKNGKLASRVKITKIWAFPENKMINDLVGIVATSTPRQKVIRTSVRIENF